MSNGSVRICWERLTHYTATVDTARMRQEARDNSWSDDEEREALAVLDRIDAGEAVTAAELGAALGPYCIPELFGDLQDAGTTEADTKALEFCRVALPEQEAQQ